MRGERVFGPTKHLVPGGRSGWLSKAGLVRCGLHGCTGVNDMEVISWPGETVLAQWWGVCSDGAKACTATGLSLGSGDMESGAQSIFILKMGEVIGCL